MTRHEYAHRWTRSVSLHPRCSCGWEADENVPGENKVTAYAEADRVHAAHIERSTE